MGWEHEPGTVWRAQELYCLERLSFGRVAQLTGVAVSTLKRWADKYRWRERRDELAQVESEIRFNTILGRKAILQRLLEAEDGKEASQVAFAVASLENLALKQAELAAAGIKSNTIRLSIGTEHIDDIIADLERGFAAAK